MFKLFIAGLLVVSVQAQANSQFDKYQELCEMQTAEEELTQKNLEVVSTVDIHQMSNISAATLKMVNHHLLVRSYADKALSISEIQDLFLTGEEKFNEIYIITLKSKSSGQVYIHVQSYPGDNPYGDIFLATTGKLVALNQDGSISIVEKDNAVYCPWN